MMSLSYEQLDNIGFRFVTDALAPLSAYGRRALGRLAPYTPAQRQALQQELDNLERAIALRSAQPEAVRKMEGVLRQLKDISASLRRCEGSVLDEVELFETKRFLLQLRDIAPHFATVQAAAGFEGLRLDACPEALALLDPEKTGVASFHLSGRYSAELTAIRREKRAVEEQIRRAAGEEKDALTLERQGIVAREQAEEARVRGDISAGLRPFLPALLADTEALARLDLLLQKAALASRFGGVKPRLGDGGRLAFSDMQSPMLAEALREAGKAFTPISIELVPGAAVITGANMGGKSVALKTLALNTLLVHCGFYPFAAEAEVPLLDAIHLVSEDLEQSRRGLSSFGGEIVRVKRLLDEEPGEAALLLLDEFARGTNPEEGAAIAWALVNELQQRRAFSLLTTHFDHVAEAAGAHWQVLGLRGADCDTLAKTLAGRSDEDGVAAIGRCMNYGLFRVTREEGTPRDALTICRLLGLPDKIVDAAERKLLTFFGDGVK